MLGLSIWRLAGALVERVGLNRTASIQAAGRRWTFFVYFVSFVVMTRVWRCRHPVRLWCRPAYSMLSIYPKDPRRLCLRASLRLAERFNDVEVPVLAAKRLRIKRIRRIKSGRSRLSNRLAPRRRSNLSVLARITDGPPRTDTGNGGLPVGRCFQ